MTELVMKLETVDGETTTKVECFAGAHIDRVCEQATKVATLLGVVVHFDFNGVPCYARPDSDWRTLAKRWDETLNAHKERPPYAMAWSDRPVLGK